MLMVKAAAAAAAMPADQDWLARAQATHWRRQVVADGRRQLGGRKVDQGPCCFPRVFEAGRPELMP